MTGGGAVVGQAPLADHPCGTYGDAPAALDAAGRPVAGPRLGRRLGRLLDVPAAGRPT
ncbi:hypothetical protein [Micromonospora sp. CPCC 205561]|uniref:hypothetical protein n=1 Tax=Micromonospora sp. CPCC 205561 TaxID=3122407 RepID=UPI002FF0EB41